MLHSVGIIHNDIKPANVMLRYDEKKKKILGVYLIDLGAGILIKS